MGVRAHVYCLHAVIQALVGNPFIQVFFVVKGKILFPQMKTSSVKILLCLKFF